MPNGTDEMVGALDPFALAALRQRRAVMPEGGRQEGPATHVLENYLPHVAKGLLALPQQATQESFQAAQGNDFDPSVMLRAAQLGIPPAPSMGKDVLGSMFLKPDPSRKLPGSKWFHIHDEASPKVPVGEIAVSNRDPGRLNVEWIGKTDLDSPAANSLGPTEIRSVLKALRQEYPDARLITGERVSGARTGKEGKNIAHMWLK